MYLPDGCYSLRGPGAGRFDPRQLPPQLVALCCCGAVLVLLEGGALSGLLEGAGSPGFQALEVRRYVATLWALVAPPLWAPPELGQRQMMPSFDDLGYWQACFPEK